MNTILNISAFLRVARLWQFLGGGARDGSRDIGDCQADLPGPICRYDLMTVCAPKYLQGKEVPRHPTDRVDHQCLTTVLFRSSWGFLHARGSVNVEVHSRMQSSDSRMVRDAARAGLGIAILPRMLVEEDVRAGTLVALLDDFPVTPYWLKLLVPRMKMRRPVVNALVECLKESIPANGPEWRLSI